MVVVLESQEWNEKGKRDRCAYLGGGVGIFQVSFGERNPSNSECCSHFKGARSFLFFGGRVECVHLLVQKKKRGAEEVRVSVGLDNLRRGELKRVYCQGYVFAPLD